MNFGTLCANELSFLGASLGGVNCVSLSDWSFYPGVTQEPPHEDSPLISLKSLLIFYLLLCSVGEDTLAQLFLVCNMKERCVFFEGQMWVLFMRK